MRKKKEKTTKNKCAFCGKRTDYYSWELVCYVCPRCLGEYKKYKECPVPYWQIGDNPSYWQLGNGDSPSFWRYVSRTDFVGWKEEK